MSINQYDYENLNAAIPGSGGEFDFDYDPNAAIPGSGGEFDFEGVPGSPGYYDPGYNTLPDWWSDRPTAPYNPTTGVTGTTTPSGGWTIDSILSKIGTSALNAIKDRYTSSTGAVDWANVLRDGASAAAAIYAYNRAKTPTPPTGYQGGIPKYNAVREQVTPAAGARPGAGGQQYFTDMQFTAPTGLAAAQAAAQTQKTQREEANQARVPMQAQVMAPPVPDTNAFFGRAPVAAAQGGLMGYAKGGGAGAPRYLSGSTDGMADKIPATIDGKQPAALAHGEFVIPADVVSHLGNGNSDAGAQQLYKMMDKIRHARTGNKEQGKRINPDKFTPGGIAKYAAGGAVQHFSTGDAVPAGSTGHESNLSNWVGPYVTDMLGKGQALSETPYQAYQGPLTAGPSALQSQAFGNAAQLATPASIGQAATTAGQIGAQAAQVGNYTPTAFGNQFAAPTATGYNAAQTAAPTTVNAQFQAPAQTGYTASQVAAPSTVTNQFQAPASMGYTAAQATGPSQVGTQSFNDAGVAASYMSPYQQNVVDIQQREAQRQADIASTSRGAQFAHSGAYGGSRQAIMDAEAARNLATQKGDIQAQGLQSAFANAQNQFNTQQQQSLAAQQANQAAGMQVGLANMGAANSAAQFGAGQNLASAQSAAQYGLAAQQANQQAGLQAGLANAGAQNTAAQFGAGQNMTAAQQAAQYNLATQQANQQAGMQVGLANTGATNTAAQFGAGQGLTAAQLAAQYGLAGQQATEASKQFGANLGLQGLSTQLSAANAQGNLGNMQNQAGLANLNAQLGIGGVQQGIDQAGVAADQAAFNEARDNPFKMVQYQQSLLQGLPLAAQSYTMQQTDPWNAALSAAGAVKAASTTAVR